MDLTFAESLAETQLVDRVSIVVSKSRILVDGVDIGIGLVRNEAGQLSIAPEYRRGMLVSPLYDYLIEKWESRQILRDLTQRDEKFQSEILFVVDREVPHGVVADVMYTAGQSRFGGFHFVVHNSWMDGLTTIDSSLPIIGHSGLHTPRYVFHIELSKTGLTVKSSSALPVHLPCSGPFCNGVDDYDWDGLNKLLVTIHDEYPDIKRYVIVPERSISYEVVVRAMDIARWGPTLSFHANKEQWQQWQDGRQELFDRPIIAGGVE
ncbi:MAG: hypothetical protein HN348_14945 [Proteobacteria bacterium]|nr:hypothetical protein [Pseudomonadota bacterium]